MKPILICLFCAMSLIINAQSRYAANFIIKVEDLDKPVRYDTLFGQQAGRKFVYCVIPDWLERDSTHTVDTIAYTQKRNLSYTFTPPQYDSIVEAIEIRPAYSFYDINPKAKLPKGAVLVPPTWEITTKKEKINDWVTIFARFKGIEMFGNDQDCIGFIVFEVPNSFAKTYQREIKTPALLVQTIDGQKIIDTLKLPSPYLKEIKVNAWVYNKTTYSVKMPATVSIIASKAVVPNNIKGMRLKRQGGLSELREHIVCYGIGSPTIRAIQKSLRKKGYWWVRVTNTNILDARTKKALVRFQKKHFLAVGNLNSETIHALDAHQFMDDSVYPIKIIDPFKTVSADNIESLDDLILLQALPDEKISELAYQPLKIVQARRNALKIKAVKKQTVFFREN